MRAHLVVGKVLQRAAVHVAGLFHDCNLRGANLKVYRVERVDLSILLVNH